MTHNRMSPLLRGAVGNGFQNDEEDVKNLKNNFKAIKRYEPEVENGYIDRELNDAIFQYQKDNNLKLDGYARPGGVTEATLIGELLGIPAHEGGNRPGTKFAAAPAIPVLMGSIGRALGRVAPAVAWDIWQNMNTDEREDVIDKAECDAIHRDDTQECTRVTRTKGKRAGAVCRASATERYAACLSGRSEPAWPPLQR